LSVIITRGARPWPFNSLPHQTLGRLGIAATLHQNLQDETVLIDGAPESVLLTADRNNGASGAGEFHPHALSEPDVILPHHPAPIVRPYP